MLLDEFPKMGMHLIRVPSHALEVVKRALSHRHDVEYVEENRYLEPTLVPNDRYYFQEWHLPKILAPQAWDITIGSSSVIIAVLDSGVDPDHPDLAAKLVPGYNFYNGNTDTSDVYGHGTKVAGAAAAISNNSIGVASVAWDVKIMPIRVTSSIGLGSVWAIVKGLVWAAEHGARVANLSFAGIAGSSSIRDAAIHVENLNGLVVAAAGNCSCYETTPENPYIVSVSATDESDDPAYFTSYGKYVDVAAPGVNIYTTSDGGYYGSYNGTSFSSPIVAGLVALMMSVNPSLSHEEIKELLLQTADDLGDLGYDIYYGYGRINAYEAVLGASGTSPHPDITPPTVQITSPEDGDIVSGDITVSVNASDDVGVKEVFLFVDSGFFGRDIATPYSFSLDTNQFSNGPHTLQAVAYDAAGNIGWSELVGVIVDNVVINSPPNVNIARPLDGETIDKTMVKIIAHASDDGIVEKIDLLIDGAFHDSYACGSDSCVANRFKWNTRKVNIGWHTITAKAYDNSGNTAVDSVDVYTR
jgi:hypothetical protein